MKNNFKSDIFIQLILFSLVLSFFIGCGFEASTNSDTNSTTATTESSTTSESSSTDSTTTNNTTTTTETTTATPYASEITLLKNSFESSDENWRVSYTGACNVTFNTTENQDKNGSLLVTARAHNYDGPFLNVTNLLVANQLYIIRGYIKQSIQDIDTYKLMAKINTTTPQYRELNRINIIDTNWNKFRAFVSFSQADIDAGVDIYINSDTNTNNFYLDEFEIAKANYDDTNNSANIIKITSSNLLETNGTIIKLKGVNLIAYDDEDGATNDLSADTFVNYSYYNYDKNDFKNVASMGFNAVRINLWYRYFEDESNPYTYKEKGFAWLNSVISWAKEAGIYVMLDMHAPQGGGFQGPANITPFWNNTTYQDRFKSLWREIARRYKDDSTVIAYDILNEPCANNQTQYLTLLDETITQIRTIDPNHIINVENGFSSDNTPFVLMHNNILYDFHFYDPWSSFTNNATSVYGTNGIDSTQMRTLFEEYSNYYNTRNIPFNVSEFGQKYSTFEAKNSEAWISDLINLINEKNGNYFYFSYKGNEFGIYDSKNSFFENSNSNIPLINLLKLKQ
ncbi:MAG: cellulase family glycosylhydrolase [Arcobacteraceae bacterium]|nr:cellulase family glycosylhydrolase [Arcobacteraceae bacterium]